MNVIKALKKIGFISALILGASFGAQALVVDQVINNLILDSIALELVSNPSLKDPVDNLPLGVDFETIEVLGMSIQLDQNDVNIATYTYHVQASFEAVDGQVGTMLCSAFYTDNKGVKIATKANCMINSPMASPDSEDDCEMDDDTCVPLDYDGEVLVDEL